MATWCAARFHSAWKARGKRADRVIQRTVTRRVLERHRIHFARARARLVIRLAGRLQSSSTTWLAGSPDPQRIRPTRSGQDPAQQRNSGYELTRYGGNVTCQKSPVLAVYREGELTPPFSHY